MHEKEYVYSNRLDFKTKQYKSIRYHTSGGIVELSLSLFLLGRKILALFEIAFGIALAAVSLLLFIAIMKVIFPYRRR